MRLVVDVFGVSEVSLRLPCLVAGIALVPVAMFVAARLTASMSAGLFAGVLVAVDRNCIFYSQEARPYAVLQLVAWMHVLAVWELVQRPSTARRVLFVLGAILQFYLHYTSALFLLGEVVFLLDVLWRKDSRGVSGRQLLCDLLLIALATIPVLTHLDEISSRREQWEQFVPFPTMASLVRTLQLDVYLLPTVVLVIAAYLLDLARKSKQQNSSTTPERKDQEAPSRKLATWLTASLIFVPAVVAWVATRRHVAALFFGRYLVSSLVAVPVAAAILSRFIPAGRIRCIAFAATIFATVWNSGMWQQWRFDGRLIGDRRQDWRGAVEFVNRHATDANQICYVRSGFVEADRLTDDHSSLLKEYCLGPVTSIYPLRMRGIPLPRTLAPNLDEVPTADQPIWFIINGGAKTRERFLTDVGARFRVLQSRSFGDVLVCEVGN